MKPKSKKNTRVNKNLIYFKTKLLKKGLDFNDICRIKCDSDHKTIIEMMPSIIKNKKLSKFIMGDPFPLTLDSLKQAFKPVQYISEDNELFWNAVVLSNFHKEINKFSILRDKFVSSILNGQIETAEHILTDIETNIGYSLWSIESRIALNNESKTYSEQQEYIDSIVLDENIDENLKFLAHQMRVRAEESLSVHRFDTIVNKVLTDIGIDDKTRQYLLFKLCRYGSTPISDLTSILLIEIDSSIIDRYMTFLKVCSMILYRKNNQETIKNLIRSLALLNNIQDKELINISFCAGTNDNLVFDENSESALTIFDKYIEADYFHVINQSKSLLESMPQQIDILEICVKSCIHKKVLIHDILDTNTVIGKIASYMTDIALKNENAHECFQQLLKLISLHSSSLWPEKIYAYIAKEYFQDYTETQSYAFKVSCLNSNPINPNKLSILETREKNIFLEKTALLNSSSTSISIYKILNSILPHPTLDELRIPIEEKYKYAARIAMKSQDYLQAINIFKTMIASSNQLYHNKGVIGIINAYLSLGLLKEAVESLTTTYLNNTNLWVKLPISNIINMLSKGNRRSMTSSIDMPIIYEIYSRHINLDKDEIKAIVYESFINSNGFLRPSEMRLALGKFDKTKLIFFLRYVCVFNVMDSSIQFNGTEEVERERIIICQMLTDIDPDNYEIYANEIKNITRNLIIKQRIREVEQSKIIVDTDGIKKLLESSLKESFNRYIVLLRNKKDRINTDKSVFELTNIQGVVFVYTINELSDLMTSMLCEARDRFVFSNEYGLDAQLSVNIRHGVIAGQLRSVFDNTNLITIKNDNNDYEDNEFWANRFNDINKEDLICVLKSLSILSKNTDDLIDKLKKTWLQVKIGDKNPEGLFDFDISAVHVKYVQRKVHETTSYDEFVDSILSFLWETTEANLNYVRNYMAVNVKDKFDNFLDETIRSINAVKDSSPIHDLLSQLAKCRTDLQDELDKIASWFTRSKRTQVSDYEIELPLTIALQMVNNIYPKRQIQPSIESTPNVKLKGRSFNCLVNILFILMDNIIAHSQHSSPSQNCHVKISHNNLTDEILIHIENDISKTINFEDEKTKLNAIKALILNGKPYEFVRKEGKSGFQKIKKILQFDLRCASHTLDFSFSENSTFYVDITFKAGDLII